MASEFSDSERIGKLTAGGIHLGLVRFEGSDGVNRHFAYEVEGIAEEPIDDDQIIGQHMTVEIDGMDGPVYYDGVAVEGGAIGTNENGHIYVFVLRPWFYLATHRENFRIFHNMSVDAILSKIFNDYTNHGSHFAFDLSQTYPELEYTVQHGQTDEDFCRRLMERFGINFSFEHSAGSHKMWLTDYNGGFGTIPGTTRDFYPAGKTNIRGEHFTRWNAKRRFTSNAVRTGDYNFKTPTVNLGKDAPGDATHSNSNLERYIYPGVHTNPGEGTKVAQTRIKQLRSQDKHVYAEGNVASLQSGYIVEMVDASEYGHVEPGEFLCTYAEHRFTGQQYGSTELKTTENVLYSGRYELVPKSVEYGPERRSSLHLVQGMQTAKVISEVSGEEIDVDKYGRILVRFYWGESDSKSMRVRVAQLWAQSNWGSFFTPRVGMEVVIIFEEGDPNKPLCIGCVYNDDNKPPYPQPDKKNWNGIKSNSTKGGGGYNELVFNDTKGDELFRQHAQFDMETKVLNDERREVDHDRQTTIGNDEQRDVGNDEAVTIGMNTSWTVGKDQVFTIGNEQTYTIGGNVDWTIDGKETRSIAGKRTTEVTGTEDLKAMSDVTIESATKITLKVGASTIEMTPAGITIQSIEIKVSASAMLKTTGTMAEHAGSGMMTIKGGVVMIN